MGFAGADEGYAEFHVERSGGSFRPGEVREGRGVLGCVWGAGEGFQRFHGDDPVADAGAEAFGVEGA